MKQVRRQTVPLKNFQYDALMRNYNQKQFLHKHEQDERIQKAEAEIPRLSEIRREIASLGLQKARFMLGASKEEISILLLKFSALPWNGAGCSPNMVILKIIWNFTMIVPFAKIRDLFSPKRRMDLVRWKNVPAFVKQQWIFCILSPTYGIY